MAFYPDEKDKPRRRPLIASGEFWLGVFTVLIGLTLAIAVTVWLLG